MTTISNVNQQYNRFETDKQRASAKRFINADDAKLNKMAHNTYNFNERANDKKFSRNVSIAVNSLPLIAVASGLASKKGAAAVIKDGAYWGIALLAPKAINAVNNKLVNVSSKVKNAERKNAGTSYMAQVAASIGAYFGATALFNKVIEKPKVKEFGKNMIGKVSEFASNAKQTIKNMKSPINLSPEAGAKLAELKAKVKVPEFAKPAIENLKNSETLKTALTTSKNIAKKAIKNAPILTVLGIGAALVAKSVSSANKFGEIKSNIKNAQLETAKGLVNAYSQENEELKAEKEEQLADNINPKTSDEDIDA